MELNRLLDILAAVELVFFKFKSPVRGYSPQFSVIVAMRYCALIIRASGLTLVISYPRIENLAPVHISKCPRFSSSCRKIVTDFFLTDNYKTLILGKPKIQ